MGLLRKCHTLCILNLVLTINVFPINIKEIMVYKILWIL
jgi:hypothetical protein